jgi:hypothetical protein
MIVPACHWRFKKEHIEQQKKKLKNTLRNKKDRHNNRRIPTDNLNKQLITIKSNIMKTLLKSEEFPTIMAVLFMTIMVLVGIFLPCI